MFGLNKLKTAYIAYIAGEGVCAKIEIHAFTRQEAVAKAQDYFLADLVELTVVKK